MLPTTAARQACDRASGAHQRVWASFEPLVTNRLADLNTQLAAAGIPGVTTLGR